MRKQLEVITMSLAQNLMVSDGRIVAVYDHATDTLHMVDGCNVNNYDLPENYKQSRINPRHVVLGVLPLY
jgi:hypothetical protein